MSGLAEVAIRGKELAIGKMFRVRYARWRAGEYAVMENLHETNWSCQYNGAFLLLGFSIPAQEARTPKRNRQSRNNLPSLKSSKRRSLLPNRNRNHKQSLNSTPSSNRTETQQHTEQQTKSQPQQQQNHSSSQQEAQADRAAACPAASQKSPRRAAETAARTTGPVHQTATTAFSAAGQGAARSAAETATSSSPSPQKAQSDNPQQGQGAAGSAAAAPATEPKRTATTPRAASRYAVPAGATPAGRRAAK